MSRQTLARDSVRPETSPYVGDDGARRGDERFAPLVDQETRPDTPAWLERLRWFHEPHGVFLVALLSNLFWVYVIVFQFNLFVTDAMSRTLHAWQVFFSANPKLAAIGFIWAPLPTLLQLPLVLFPPLRHLGLSANVLTALMGAVTIAFLVATLRRFGLSVRYRWAVVALWSVNPMVMFYSSNGMSEMTFAAFTVISVYFLVVWHQTGRLFALMMMGCAVGMAFLARYDTAFHAAGLVAALIILMWNRPRSSLGQAEGILITYGLPVAFAGGGWLAANLIIMGDPLHFARGDYSNAAQIDYQLALLPYLTTLIGRPDRISLFMLNQIVALYPVFVAGFAVMVGDFLATRNRLSLSFALLALSFPMFQAFNFYTGQTAAFLRYFILAIPWGIITVSYFLSRLRRAPAEVRRLATIGALSMMLISTASSGAAMIQASEWGQWNDVFIESLLTGKRVDTWKDEREIAEFISARISSREILVDDFQGYRIIFYTGKPWLFVANSDSDFRASVEEPQGRVKYMLVSSLRLEGVLNQINKKYPTLYDEGAPWVKLEGSWPKAAGIGWKLYRVLDPREMPAVSAGADGSGGAPRTAQP